MVQRRYFLLLAFLIFLPAVSGAQTHSWIAGENTRFADQKIFKNFLAGMNGHIRPMICSYSGSVLDSAISFTGTKLSSGDAVWQYGVNSSFRNDEAGRAASLTMTFRLLEGKASSSGVAVAFDFEKWSIDNYILVPSQLYGGNRFRILPLRYPPYIHNEADRPLDMPVTVTNILHLNSDGSHAKVEMKTGNVATPMLSFFNPVQKRGFILLTDQESRFGNNGLFVEEDAANARKIMTFVVSAPGVREQRYVMCGRAPSKDKGADWKAGDEVTLRFRLYDFRADDMTAFYDKVFDVRKALSGENSFDCVTPFSVAADLILKHHNDHKWFENDSTAYYGNRPGDKSPYHHQIGWSGVPVFSFPQLMAETPERLRRVCLSLQNMLFESQGKTGLYYAVNKHGKIYGDPHGKMGERTTIAMTRRSMDALYFGIKTFDLMKKRGHPELIKPEWESSLRRCADGLLKVWNDYGQFGQFIDVDNGKMDINGSTAGCAAGSALAVASVYFKVPEYLETAEKATRMYYERDFLHGYAGGGAAEILQSPDSEAPWDMVESCIVLYSVTGKQEWVERAKFAAHMLSTWMVSYDYHFPDDSGMGKVGINATGSIFASSQNNHGAPGYYILSGDFMLKLFRATGDNRFGEMYRDHNHNMIQYIGAPHNPLGKPDGYVTERVQLSDWEGNNIGHINYDDSNMAWEILGALACLENPGIYLHTDDDTFIVLDHVQASVLKRDRKGVTLTITNPTLYDARVKILAETAAQAKIPLQLNAFDTWPGVDVKAGQTIKVSAGPGVLKVIPE